MLLIKGSECDQYKAEMEDVYRLRHKIFVEEMGWEELRKSDGREIDEFDNDDALHMLIYEQDELIGYQRMLPTTKPNLLSHVYPQLCEGKLPNDENIWEWTRFAVAKEHRKGIRKLSRVGNLLVSGIVEWGMQKGVNSIVIEMFPIWLLHLVQLHFRVHHLGRVHMINGEEVMAVQAMFDKQTLNKLHFHRGDTQPVIKPEIKKRA